MGKTQQFIKYAAAFEEAFETDDWTKVGTFFTDDAVYETTGTEGFNLKGVGRDGILATLKRSVDALDRHFDRRDVSFVEGPLERDGQIWFRWVETLEKSGFPPLLLEGEEFVTFEGDRIKRLEDRFTPALAERVAAYMAAHGAKLAAA